jgi:copper resistance protein C
MRRHVISWMMLALAAAGALGAAPALAHTKMSGASIADKAVLKSAPADFSINFEHEARLASVRLVSASGAQLPVPFKPAAAAAKSFTVPLPKLAPGAYTLSWRALAADGHVMPGSVRFTILGG